MTAENIPILLVHNHQQVGTAKIENNTMTIDFDNDTTPRSMMRLIEMGLVDGILIDVKAVPAKPKASYSSNTEPSVS